MSIQTSDLDLLNSMVADTVGITAEAWAASLDTIAIGGLQPAGYVLQSNGDGTQSYVPAGGFIGSLGSNISAIASVTSGVLDLNSPINGPSGVVVFDIYNRITINTPGGDNGAFLLLNGNVRQWNLGANDVDTGYVGAFTIQDVAAGYTHCFAVQMGAPEGGLVVQSDGSITAQGNPLVVTQDLSTTPTNTTTPVGWIPTTVGGTPSWIPYYQ